jgi:hypothetical protein
LQDGQAKGGTEGQKDEQEEGQEQEHVTERRTQTID